MDELICVYLVNPDWFRASRYSATRPMGQRREQFLLESLRALDERLRPLGQRLNVAWARPPQPKVHDSAFVARWGGAGGDARLDSVDAAGWPITRD